MNTSTITEPTVFTFKVADEKETAIENEAIRREIYRKVFDLFKNFHGTIVEMMEKYGMDARGLVYKGDISEKILLVCDGKMTMEEAKEWLKGFVAVAFSLSGRPYPTPQPK
jgi:hypothetical protein